MGALGLIGAAEAVVSTVQAGFVVEVVGGFAARARGIIRAGGALDRAGKALVDQELKIKTVKTIGAGGIIDIAGLAGNRDEQAGEGRDA